MKPALLIALCVLCFCGGYFVSHIGGDAPTENNRERDSLLIVESGLRVEIAALTHYTDSVKAHTDSVVATFPSDEVIVEEALRFTRYAPLDAVRDTLMTP